MLCNKAYGNPMEMVSNNYIIAYSTNKALYVSRNPLYYNKINPFGYDESLKYRFIDYCTQFLYLKIPEYDKNMDKWVILPYFLTPLHLYSYFNHSEYITSAFNNGANLIQSRLHQNPLSIAVSRDFENCAESILRPLKAQISQNPFILSFIDEKSLIEMNITSHTSLP